MPLNKNFTIIRDSNKLFIVPIPNCDITNFDPYEINEPIEYIFNMLKEGYEPKKIASKMCLIYMADPVELETDILELIVIFKSKGIYYSD